MNNELTTDNMSNEEVIEVLKGIVFNGFDRTTRKERQALDLAIKALEEQDKKGEWIHYLGCGVGKAVCSECGQIGETKKYCGNCGAEMEGSEEE